MDKKRILVTGIGGNVGQGIIRNIRSLGYPIEIIGCNTLAFSAGNHLCDKFYEVPFAYTDNYITTIRNIVIDEDIDLIIPSTDYEVYYLSQYKDEIPCKLAVSDQDTAEIYLDKYKTYLHHKQFDIPFAPAFLPSTYDGSFSDYIVKPREGRGSRGIHINPESLIGFNDDYMIQQLITGTEITTAFYVNKKNELHGFINLKRQLDNGATNECYVDQQNNVELEKILTKIINHSKISGSANLQSILTDEGQIIPFEINCRISGTNSIRSNFGFEDVKYTLQEFLYEEPISKPEIIEGVAIRIMMDVIYKNQNDKNMLLDNSSPSFIF
ncbi:carbamoyl-phosphate synthase large subunit [Pedobacter sp. CAN_A7]|uniref:ATP-grasp domain-containing protein n=1 Tax=Pedobacter sp. CAN_A7 TaxID=2787722 RepID=UPI0018CAD3EF